MKKQKQTPNEEHAINKNKTILFKIMNGLKEIMALELLQLKAD